MNGIAEMQNQPHFLEKLAASNHLYDQSVRIGYIQLLTAVLIAIVFPILGNKYPETQSALTVLTLAYFVFQVFFLHHWESKKRMHATVLQELFDTELYSLEWNEVIAGEELTEKQLKKYLAKNKNIDKDELQNWYPPAVSGVPLPIARTLCQRSSVWWNGHLRRLCSQIITVLILGLLGTLIWQNHSAPAGKLATQIVLFLPLFEILSITAVSYRKSAGRMERLRVLLDSFLKKFAQDPEFQVEEKFTRAVQDEIFRNRASARPTPRFIYALLLSKYKQTMNLKAEEYIKELVS